MPKSIVITAFAATPVPFTVNFVSSVYVFPSTTAVYVTVYVPSRVRKNPSSRVYEPSGKRVAATAAYSRPSTEIVFFGTSYQSFSIYAPTADVFSGASLFAFSAPETDTAAIVPAEIAVAAKKAANAIFAFFIFFSFSLFFQSAERKISHHPLIERRKQDKYRYDKQHRARRFHRHKT